MLQCDGGRGWGLRTRVVGRNAEGRATKARTPEYDAFMTQQAEADRDKSKDPAKPKAENPKRPQ